jgi:hypothetical protein
VIRVEHSFDTAFRVGAGFAYLQFTQQQRAAQDLLISNQVSKGFELLGNKDGQLEQRLGGIYALEGVINTSEQYHRPVLEALCAFVRDRTQQPVAAAVAAKVPEAIMGASGAAMKQPQNPTHSPTAADLSLTAADVQAALTVIGRRDLKKEAKDEALQPLINLEGVHIPKAYLSGAFLGGAYLHNADLSGADLTRAILRAANLSGADLTRAILRAASLFGADLSGANLSGADLDYAHLGYADLSHADLSGAKNLTQAQLGDACGDKETKLDPPLTIKPCPSK